MPLAQMQISAPPSGAQLVANRTKSLSHHLFILLEFNLANPELLNVSADVCSKTAADTALALKANV